MSKVLKSFSIGEDDAFGEWIDGAESSGEMNGCPLRADIILKLARQELERLGHDPVVDEFGVVIEMDVLAHGIQIYPGLGIIIYARGERGNPGSLIRDIYDDSLESLSEILNRIPPSKSFPYRMIGRSYSVGSGDDVFHCNFIGRIPVVSPGGRHCFFEGRLVAAGCDQDGNYCHFEIDDAAGFREARRE